MQPRIVLILAVLLAAIVAGCGGAGDKKSGQAVVAAFYPLALAAQTAAPGRAVTNLTPAGAEPHDLELTARDVERVRDAELVLYVGGGFIPALEDAVAGEANAVDLLDGLVLIDMPGGTSDPHVWLDPIRYAAIAERIASELGVPDAAAAFVADLERLDRELREGLAACQRRTIVTSHAAFGYLADAYDLEQIPLTGVSPEAEPSAKAVEELVALVKRTGSTTVFFETLVAPDLAETVAREAGVTTAALNPLEGLGAEEIEAGADYFSVMRDNLATLRQALGCR